MQSDGKVALATVAVAFLMTFGCVSMMDTSDAETTYDKDLGLFWSYTVQFIFDGEQAQTIEWDFGDGSEKSTEFNPRHQFPDKGVYTITQTTKNTVGETVEKYKVEIMGFPTVTFVYGNGNDDVTVQQDGYNKTVGKPADPVWEGHTFNGWFTDKKCTEEYDWTAGVTEPVTLYAGWDDGSVAVDDDFMFYAMIVCFVLAAIMAIAAIVTKMTPMFIPAVFLAIAGVICAVLYYGVI